jgi:glycine/D-amino acid oxidase-like deaminating enzyme
MRDAPYFFDTFTRSRRPEYSRHRGDTETRIAIIGGGLTGCACAASFAAAGIDAVVFEANRIGGGGTAAAAGLMRHDPDASFRDALARHGVRTSRHVWQSFRRAALDFSAVLRRIGVRADISSQDLLWFTRGNADAVRLLQREYQARRDAGVETGWLKPRAVSATAAIEASGAIRSKADALDPYRACVGLAADASARGATLHERTTVRRIRVGRKHVEIRTDGGTVVADAVLIASGSLIDDLKALRRHFAPSLSYAVVTERLPAAVRREVGRRATALRDQHAPPHLLRWIGDDRVLFAGAERRSIAPRLREKALVPNAQELMYELSTIYPAISGVQPEWAWDAVSYGSPDGLPVVGPHRNFPRHLFALGFAQHGPAASWLAARVLLRAYRGEPAKGDELFGFARVL